ncbi:hypothetical protein HYY69_01330 [Candidatus Woesearchaeota archaeon]|nr:hypothetical protein [Candidatus Woesearchaeota archaeon]
MQVEELQSSLDHDVLRILARAAYRVAVHERFYAQLYPYEEWSEVPDSGALDHVLAQSPFRDLSPSRALRRKFLSSELNPFIDYPPIEDRVNDILTVLHGYLDLDRHSSTMARTTERNIILFDDFLKYATLLDAEFPGMFPLVRDPFPTSHGIFIPALPSVFNAFVKRYDLVYKPKFLQPAQPIVPLPLELYKDNHVGDASCGLCYLVQDKGDDDKDGLESGQSTGVSDHQEGSTAFFKRVQRGVGLTFQRMPKIPIPRGYRTDLSYHDKVLWRCVLQAERKLYQNLVAYVMVDGKYSVKKLMRDNNIPLQDNSHQQSLQQYFTALVTNGTLDQQLIRYIGDLSEAIVSLCNQITSSRARPKVKGIVLYDDQSFMRQARSYEHRLANVSLALRNRVLREVKDALYSQEFIF